MSSETTLQIIRKSNELIEARYRLSIAEQRIVLLLASEITPDDEDFKDYEIRVSDFASMFGLKSDKSLYKEVEQSAEALLTRVVVLKDGMDVEKTGWLSNVKYMRGSGIVRIRFDKSLKPYFLQLKSHFTQYHLHYVLNFKCQYSIRLYENLKMDAFKAKNGMFQKDFTVKLLRNIFGVEKNDYSLFADFKKRTIEPASYEISDQTDLNITDIQYIKTGKKITDIRFFVTVRSDSETKLRQGNLRIEAIPPENKEGNTHPIITSLVELGFSLETAKKYKNKYGVKVIDRNIAFTLAKKQEGNVKDVPAYLNKAIEADWGGSWDSEKKKDEDRKKSLILEAKKKKDADIQKQKADALKSEIIVNDFLLLPEEERQILLIKFLGSLDGMMKDRHEKSYKEHGENALHKSKTFQASFIVFMKKT